MDFFANYFKIYDESTTIIFYFLVALKLLDAINDFDQITGSII